jgi:large subunit ribosomal protein L15
LREVRLPLQGLARRGFSNYPFKKEYEIVNLSMIEARYADNESVTAAT